MHQTNGSLLRKSLLQSSFVCHATLKQATFLQIISPSLIHAATTSDHRNIGYGYFARRRHNAQKYSKALARDCASVHLSKF
ncbi:unnamed protein product [Lathyrus oleraceus]